MKIFLAFSISILLLNSVVNAQRLIVINYEDVGDRNAVMIISMNKQTEIRYRDSIKADPHYLQSYILSSQLFDSLYSYVMRNDTKVCLSNPLERIRRKSQYRFHLINDKAISMYDLVGINETKKYFGDLALWMANIDSNNEDWKRLSTKVKKIVPIRD